MNIRQKCAAAIAVSLAISAVLNVAVLRFSVFPSFIDVLAPTFMGWALENVTGMEASPVAQAAPIT